MPAARFAEKGTLFFFLKPETGFPKDDAGLGKVNIYEQHLNILF